LAPAVVGGALISQVSSEPQSSFATLGNEAAGTTNQVKVTMTTPSLVAGVYKLTFQADIGTSLAIGSARCISDVIFDGVTVHTGFSTLGGTPTNGWTNMAGFAYITLTAGVKTGTINWRCSGPPTNGATTFIRRARMDLTRIS